MSSNTPQDPAQGTEYVGSGSAATPANRSGSGKKWAVLGGAAIGVAAVVTAGGWAAFSLLATGSQPSEAIPATAVGYLSLDLDPSASQKIEAFKILQKFPGVEKDLDIGGRDDLRRYVFDMMQEDGVCEDLNYAEDVEPWIGDRIAVAAMPGDKGSVAPLVTLQVTDEDAAATGVERLFKCNDADDAVGFSFSGDYVLIGESKKQADAYAADAEESSLADDVSFQEWTEAVGDPGVVTMYASADAPSYAVGLQKDLMGSALAPSSGVLTSGADPMDEQMKEMYKDFEGMAGVVRFADGAAEVEFAGGGVPAGLPESGESPEDGISSLPASTGAAMSLSLSDGWAESYLEQMSAMLGDGAGLEDSLAQMETQTGLSLPEDIETLLGDNVSVAVDSDIDFRAATEDPTAVPAGIKVLGDPAEILPVVDKIKANFGPDADLLLVESSDDAVAFGFAQGYMDSLLEEGQLGDDETFQNVVPEAGKAVGVFYVDFDAGDGWASELADFASGGDPEATKNVEPLDALGVSAWVDDGTQHGLLRLTTD